MTFQEIKQRLRRKSVGIAGCGGLGSNCAVALARVGVGRLVIVDFDAVTVSNLNRQYFFLDQIGMKKVEALRENIRRIDPAIGVEVADVKLTPDLLPGLFASCDVVVEAFDRADQKEMLIETMLKDFPEKPLVVGLGVAGWGRTDLVHFRKSGNLYICGDEVSEISVELPPLAPRVGMVANMQANVVVEILLSSEVAR
ncbi:MAG: sulfur carrier protein ThiS adenylyltransferase ThiF [Bacteroidetes bacterium]|nr:MAG: sulfur carrier protein ThiS adenylyltransferase ThiF [Bacteroidota bacterium]